MSEPTAEATIETPTAQTPAAGTEQAGPEAPTPPWGSDEEFNPQRAWDLIQNLRGEKDEAKAKVREFEDARLTAEQKAARDADELRGTNGELATENALLKAVIAHPELTTDDIDLLRGVPADAVAERAAKLAARLGAGTPQKPLTARPTEALRGGADPTVPVGGGSDWLRTALAKND